MWPRGVAAGLLRQLAPSPTSCEGLRSRARRLVRPAAGAQWCTIVEPQAAKKESAVGTTRNRRPIIKVSASRDDSGSLPSARTGREARCISAAARRGAARAARKNTLDVERHAIVSTSAASAAKGPKGASGSDAKPKEPTPKRIISTAGEDSAKATELKPWTPAMRKASPLGPAMTILSWNVAGIRALLKKNADAIKDLVEMEDSPDVICLQETKLQGKHEAEIEEQLGLAELGYSFAWNSAAPPSRLGYSGVAVLTRDSPREQLLEVTRPAVEKEADCEGRVLTAEYKGLFIVNVYVPNSGQGLKRLDFRTTKWDKAFSLYLQGLRAIKPVVVTGDLNVAHQAIDIHSPKTNLRSAGFTQEERDSFNSLFIGNGLVDLFRHQHPDTVAYSYWSYMRKLREKNKGWRIDYTLVSEDLLDRCFDSFTLPEVMGSDHCPVGMTVMHTE